MNPVGRSYINEQQWTNTVKQLTKTSYTLWSMMKAPVSRNREGLKQVALRIICFVPLVFVTAGAWALNAIGGRLKQSVITPKLSPTTGIKPTVITPKLSPTTGITPIIYPVDPITVDPIVKPIDPIVTPIISDPNKEKYLEGLADQIDGDHDDELRGCLVELEKRGLKLLQDLGHSPNSVKISSESYSHSAPGEEMCGGSASLIITANVTWESYPKYSTTLLHTSIEIGVAFPYDHISPRDLMSKLVDDFSSMQFIPQWTPGSNPLTYNRF